MGGRSNPVRSTEECAAAADRPIGLGASQGDLLGRQPCIVAISPRVLIGL